MDSLRGSSVKIGTMQRRLAWPLRKDDKHKSRSVNNNVIRHNMIPLLSQAARSLRSAPARGGRAAGHGPYMQANTSINTYIYIYTYTHALLHSTHSHITLHIYIYT